MRRITRLFRQWRESWADAAYDDVRAEMMRLQIVQLAQVRAIERLTDQVKTLAERAKAKV